MAAFSQRGRPGGNQRLFQFKPRRSEKLFLEACLVCLGTVGVLGQAAGAEQHWIRARLALASYSGV